MGIEKVRRGFYIKGPLTIGGAAIIGGNVTATGGTVTFGADVVLARTAANQLDLATGDTLRLRSGTLVLATDTTVKRDGAGTVGIGAADVLNLGGTVQRFLAPNDVAYPTLAKNGAVHVISALPGTARLYFRAGGTTYYIDADG